MTVGRDDVVMVAFLLGVAAGFVMGTDAAGPLGGLIAAGILGPVVAAVVAVVAELLRRLLSRSSRDGRSVPPR